MSPGFEKHPPGPGDRGLVPGEGWADDGWSRFREAVSWEIDLSSPPPPSYSPLFTTECLIVLAERPLVLAPPPASTGPRPPSPPLHTLTSRQQQSDHTHDNFKKEMLSTGLKKEKTRGSAVPTQVQVSCAHTEPPFPNLQL